jgi:hypothetical protein
VFKTLPFDFNLISYRLYLMVFFFNVVRSVGFDGECLGQHLGLDQQANLGDGNGIREFHFRVYSSYNQFPPLF